MNQDINAVFSTLKTRHILAVGDIMLDRFFYGAVERISPEGPIPVIRIEHEKRMLGGVGNVVANIVSIGAKASVIAVTGDDNAQAEIKSLLHVMQIDGRGLIQSADRPTILKDRYIAQRQQLLRADWEKTDAIPKALEDAVIAQAELLIKNCHALVLSDYGKGLLTPRVIKALIALAQSHQLPIIVDPKGTDFARYRGATIITPNRKELELATGLKAGSDDEVEKAALKLITDCGIQSVLATRSEKGMSLITQDAPPLHIPTEAQAVYDVTGAGDTVVATFSAFLGAGMTAPQAAELANLAAGIVVGKVGTATVRPDEFMTAFYKKKKPLTADTNDSETPTSLYSLSALVDERERWRAENLKVGMTNGCFDLLHKGHLSLIKQAKAECDRLIIALNSDASVSRIKGPSRPVHDEKTRASILSALRYVDAVVIFDDDSVLSTIQALKPDVLVKGADYTIDKVVGSDFVMAYGGRVHLASLSQGQSTTNTIKKMQNNEAA
jgi:D-beta-D-heptose 7-phosphate kinase/D-beta-D-heptose 1-phosphate adenosyltransferase